MRQTSAEATPIATEAPKGDEPIGVGNESAKEPVTVEILPEEEAFPDGFRVEGRIKWFDATRGFGFLVSDQVDGDILVHFSVLRDHDLAGQIASNLLRSIDA